MAGEINSFSKVSAEAKRNRGIAAMAFRIAKEKDDMLYKKSVKYKKLWKKASEAIAVKFKGIARQRYLDSKNKSNNGNSK